MFVPSTFLSQKWKNKVNTLKFRPPKMCYFLFVFSLKWVESFILILIHCKCLYTTTTLHKPPQNKVETFLKPNYLHKFYTNFMYKGLKDVNVLLGS